MAESLFDESMSLENISIISDGPDSDYSSYGRELRIRHTSSSNQNDNHMIDNDLLNDNNNNNFNFLRNNSRGMDIIFYVATAITLQFSILLLYCSFWMIYSTESIVVVFLSTLDEDFGNIRFTGAARLVLFLGSLLFFFAVSGLCLIQQRNYCLFFQDVKGAVSRTYFFKIIFSLLGVAVFILEIVLMAMLIENRSLTQSFLMKYLDKQKYNREKKFFEPNDQNNINRFIRDNVSSSQFHVIENTFGCCGLNGVEDYYSKELSTISLPRTCLNVVKNMGGNFNTLTFDDYQLINSSVVSEPINDQSSFINFINRRAGKIQTMCDNNIREVESIQQTVPNIPIGCRHILPEYFRTRFTSMLSMNISAVLITISYIIISFMFLVTSKKLI